MRTPTTDQVNHLNSGLMVLSCLAAYAFPFELFLFSYAVLGPLHYLTEISWLHDRRYFTRAARARRGWLVLVAVTMGALVCGVVAAEVFHRPVDPRGEVALFYLVFVTAVLAALLESRGLGVAVVGLSLAVMGLGLGSRYFVILAFFLVTIIHVLLFTGAFILHGAVRSRSLSGALSLAVFVLCAASFFVYAPGAIGDPAGEYVRQSYRSFNGLNAELIKLFGFGPGTSEGEIYESAAGLTVMRLIAFAYTYHFLNWFSKTSVIGWHEISRRRTAGILGLWLVSLALYARDYDSGMALLYLLSVLHVMLEFPLNHRTLAGIVQALGPRARAAPAG
jgi:hypothetical protein